MTSTQTDTQTTLRVTSVAIGRIYAMRAMRPKTSQGKQTKTKIGGLKALRRGVVVTELVVSTKLLDVEPG